MWRKPNCGAAETTVENWSISDFKRTASYLPVLRKVAWISKLMQNNETGPFGCLKCNNAVLILLFVIKARRSGNHVLSRTRLRCLIFSLAYSLASARRLQCT